MFGQVGCRNDALRQGDAVIGQKDNLDPVFDALVIVDALGHGVDCLDDAFGHVVARSGFGGKNEYSRGNLNFRVL